MNTRTFAPLLVAVAAMASCSTTTSGSPAPAGTTSTSVSGSSSSSTTSVSVPYTLTAPHPPPGKKNDGTSFDPCVAYTADEIRSWGVDPSKVEDIATRKLEYRGCNWSADGWSIEQGVINNPISDYLNTPYIRGRTHRSSAVSTVWCINRQPPGIRCAPRHCHHNKPRSTSLWASITRRGA